MILSEEFPISTQVDLAMVAMLNTEVAGADGGGRTVAGDGGQQPGGSQQDGQQQQQHGGRAGEGGRLRPRRSYSGKESSPGWRQRSSGLALGATVTPVLS